jgi:hypothetical protein
MLVHGLAAGQQETGKLAPESVFTLLSMLRRCSAPYGSS